MSFAPDLKRPLPPGQPRWSATGLVLCLVLCHCLLWAWVGISSRSNLDVPGDMVETYVWAQGWQWGYFKHPPLAAWVSGLWFAVFPETDWAFSLLAACNAALGLVGLAVLAREFLPAHQVWKVLALAALTPSLGSLALRFNCNSVLIAVWPWATAFFVRAMQRGRAADALACGLACGLAMLGKYFSGVLLLALVCAAAWVPAWRARLRSKTTVLALLAFALSFGPHLQWLLAQTKGPLQYAKAATAAAATEEPGSSVLRALNFALSQHAFLWVALGALAVALVGPGRWRMWLSAAASPFAPASKAWRQGGASSLGQGLWILAVVPILATLVATVLTGARTASLWGLPMACTLALLLVFTVQTRGGQISGRRLAACALAIWLLVAVGSPLWWQTRARKGAQAVAEPRLELTHAVQQLWQAQFPGQGLRFVTGTRPLAASISFYSQGRARYWSGFDRAVETPWVPAQAIAAAGTALVCEMADTTCLALGQAWGAMRHEVTVSKTTRGHAFAPQRFAAYLVAPAAK